MSFTASDVFLLHELVSYTRPKLFFPEIVGLLSG
jgi:hypothetical protein